MKDQLGYNFAVEGSVKLGLKRGRHDRQIVTYALEVMKAGFTDERSGE